MSDSVADLIATGLTSQSLHFAIFRSRCLESGVPEEIGSNDGHGCVKGESYIFHSEIPCNHVHNF